MTQQNTFRRGTFEFTRVMEPSSPEPSSPEPSSPSSKAATTEVASGYDGNDNDGSLKPPMIVAIPSPADDATAMIMTTTMTTTRVPTDDSTTDAQRLASSFRDNEDDESHHSQQCHQEDDEGEDEMSNNRGRIPLNPALASSSPLMSPTLRHNNNHNQQQPQQQHRRQPTGFHEKQLDANDSGPGGSDSKYTSESQQLPMQQQQQQQQQQKERQRQAAAAVTMATTTINALSFGRRSIMLRLHEEVAPLPPPRPQPPTPFRQSPLISSVQSLRRLRSISLSGRAFAVISNAASAAIAVESNSDETISSSSATREDAIHEVKSDIVHPLSREEEDGIQQQQQEQRRGRIVVKGKGGGEGGEENATNALGGRGIVTMDEKVEVVDHGSIVISWYDGTTSNEMQEHVRNCVLRKLNDTRKKTTIGGEGVAAEGGGTIKLVDVRLLDEHGGE